MPVLLTKSENGHCENFTKTAGGARMRLRLAPTNTVARIPFRRVQLLLLVMILVAGCTQTHEPIAPVTPASPSYFHPITMRWAGDQVAVMNDTCTPATCVTSRNSAFDP